MRESIFPSRAQTKCTAQCQLVRGPAIRFRRNMLVTSFPFICFISFATAGSLMNLNFLMEFMRRFPLRHVLVITDTGSGES